MKYGIGLDIGISSVGFATVLLDETEEPIRILDIGSRIFDRAENPKTGASLAQPRRIARGTRRRLRRCKHRKERIKNLLINENVLTKTELDELYNDNNLEDIYELRVMALDEKITNLQFARILLHFAQRRGFKSNRKTDAKDKENGKLIVAVSENEKEMQKNGYRTAGEMFLLSPRFAQHKRNQSESYIATVAREMVENEAKLIFATQRNIGNNFATSELEAKYLDILLSQRPFDLGPGGNSPYGGDMIGKMVGICTFLNTEPNKEPRAPKASYSFEYFNLLQKINNMRIISNNDERKLNDEERNVIITLAHKSPNITFASIRKALNLGVNDRFNFLRYTGNNLECEKKESFNFLKAYHEMRKALDKVSKGRINTFSTDMRNDIAVALSYYKTDDKIIEYLKEKGFEKLDIDAILTIGSFSKFGHLSSKACDMIIPFLEKGQRYDEACTSAGFDFKAHTNEEKSKFLPSRTDEFDRITSPVVLRAMSQTIKVINAIIRQRGESPTFVNIELARELSKNFTERNNLDKDMRENAAKNERYMEELRHKFNLIKPTGQDLVKLKLYYEQNGISLYSLKAFDINRLFENGYAEIDHIIPYSISFDDTYNNKALVFSSENQEKGNHTPMQYLQGKKREDFEVYVKTNIKSQRRLRLLLKEKITVDDEKTFKERNLQDTKTIATFMYNYISDNLQFAPSINKKRQVYAVNGATTSLMRKRFNINKIREDGDIHHAIDALVIACTTQGVINKIKDHYFYKETKFVHSDNGCVQVNPENGEVIKEFPYPWKNFRNEIDARFAPDPAEKILEYGITTYDTEDLKNLEPVFVSRMAQYKVTGAAHKETIRSAVALDEGFLVSKVPLSKLKLDSDGEIANYYMPSSDKLLYDALKSRLVQFGGSGEKAFTEPFYKPLSKKPKYDNESTKPTEVKKVKVYDKSTLNVMVNDKTAAAANGSMLRVDVFYVPTEGYYLVPIYVSDTLKSILPNKAIVNGKLGSDWKEMDDKFFIFSLYHNDLIKITSKRTITLKRINEKSTLPASYTVKQEYAYYISTDVATASVDIINNDNSYKFHCLGIKSLEKLEKCKVDILGNISMVKKEKRVSFKK